MGPTPHLPRGASYGGRIAPDSRANNSRTRAPIGARFAPSDAHRPGATFHNYVPVAILQDGGAGSRKPGDIDGAADFGGDLRENGDDTFFAMHGKVLRLPLPFPTRLRNRKSNVPFARKMAPNEIEYFFAPPAAISRRTGSGKKPPDASPRARCDDDGAGPIAPAGTALTPPECPENYDLNGRIEIPEISIRESKGFIPMKLPNFSHFRLAALLTRLH